MKPKPDPGAVSPTHLAALRDAQQRLANAQAVMTQLEACGEDCQRERELASHYDAKIKAVLQAFFPNAKTQLP